MDKNRKGVALPEQAHRLLGVLQQILARLGLALSPPKCKNFIIFSQGRALGLFKRGDPTTRWMKTKEEARHGALQLLTTQTQQGIRQDQQMPFPGIRSIKLLGLKLDSQWSFHQHMEEMQDKLGLRSEIAAKVGNSTWRLENRVMTTTAHTLIESLINYGLNVTGSVAAVGDFNTIDTRILNPIARGVAGVGYTIRREILFSLANLGSVRNSECGGSNLKIRDNAGEEKPSEIPGRGKLKARHLTNRTEL